MQKFTCKGNTKCIGLELEIIFAYSGDKNKEGVSKSNEGLSGHDLEFGVYSWHNWKIFNIGAKGSILFKKIHSGCREKNVV